MAGPNAGAQTADAGHRSGRQQERAHRGGPSHEGRGLPSSGRHRVGGADARLSEGMRRSTDRYGATSVRRSWENQAQGKRFERAVVMWSRLSHSHTGPRHVTHRIRGRTHGSTRSRAALVQRYCLHPRGCPYMPLRGCEPAALAARSRTIAARHVGGRSRLVQEHPTTGAEVFLAALLRPP